MHLPFFTVQVVESCFKTDMDRRGIVLIVCYSVLLVPTSVIASTITPSSTASTNNDTDTTSSTSSATTTAPKTVDCDDDSGEGRGIGIGIGIMLLITAVVVGPLVYLLWRRGWTLPCNTDLSNKAPGHDNTPGSVTAVNAKKTYTRPNKEENSKSSQGKGAASRPNYNSYHPDGKKPSYEHLGLQKTDSVDQGDVYEDPDKGSAPASASARPQPGRPQPEPPMSDVYVDTEGPCNAGYKDDDDDDYVAPVTSVGKGSGDVVRLPDRAPPEGKRRSSLHDDDDDGEIYENTNAETPPPPRPSKGRESTKNQKTSSGSPQGAMDDIYIDMEGGGKVESVYMNTE